MTIKGNQPTLLAAAQQALSGPAAEFAEYTEHDRGHGRTEERILRTAPITADAPIDFPHAAQVFRVIRYVGGLDGQRRTKEVAHSRHQPHPRQRRRSRPRPAAARPLGCHRDQTPLGARHHLSTRTNPPSAPAPHHRPWRSSATPSWPRSGSPDGPTSRRPAATSHTASVGERTRWYSTFLAAPFT